MTQDSYIGNTTASQAVKAGSTPVSCSMKKAPLTGCFFYGAEAGGEPIECGCPVGIRLPPVSTVATPYAPHRGAAIDSRILLQKHSQIRMDLGVFPFLSHA